MLSMGLCLVTKLSALVTVNSLDTHIIPQSVFMVTRESFHDHCPKVDSSLSSQKDLNIESLAFDIGKGEPAQMTQLKKLP